MRALVVDDEPLGRERVVGLLTAERDIEVVACASGREALDELRSAPFDVVFVDIEMPELDGFGLIEAMPPWSRPQVVFVTAHDCHAVRAFGVRALDYLLKPFDRLRFGETLARVREATSRAPQQPPRLAVKSADGNVIFVDLGDVEWIGAAGNYVEIHIGGASSHLVRQTLTEMASLLPAARFGRVHRGAIVNLDRICELRSGIGRDAHVVVRSGAAIPVGKSFRGELEARLRLVR